MGSQVETTETADLRLFGHMRRKIDNRPPKKIYYWMPKGRRKRGRPKLALVQGIAQTMRGRGLKDGITVRQSCIAGLAINF